MSINNYFDKIYVLNLSRRKDRWDRISSNLNSHNIQYEKFIATDGYLLNSIWKKNDNKYFSTSNYLACCISHLSIYMDAISNNYQRILIIEDDVLINKDINLLFDNTDIPEWEDIFYLGYIPLSDDQTMWDYTIISKYINNKIFSARNLWGLYAYGITFNLMKEMIEVYKDSFPMEIDRYFVNFVQPRLKSIGISPQLFCCQDIYSDNMSSFQTGMLDRSVDTRFAKDTDYI